MTERRRPDRATDRFRAEQVRTLDDGFERLGDADTPFTLRGSPPNWERAEERHADRPESERRRDELGNEPVTRDLDWWQESMKRLDFPGVDTVPAAVQRRRVAVAAGVVADSFGVDDIDRDVAFADDAVRGRYWRGREGKIEVGTDPDDFPGYREPAMLAHELGHAVDDRTVTATGFSSEREAVFQSDRAERAAKRLSERLRGPIVDLEGPGTNYRKLESELVADTFALRVLEPRAALDRGEPAVGAVEERFSEFFAEFDDRATGTDAFHPEWIVEQSG